MGLFHHLPESLDDVPNIYKAGGVGLIALTGYTVIKQMLYYIHASKINNLRQDFIQKNKKHKEDFAIDVKQNPVMVLFYLIIIQIIIDNVGNRENNLDQGPEIGFLLPKPKS